ncbi:MAG: hypothetical protein ABI946_05955 [Chthoniobacterales bacterium]
MIKSSSAAFRDIDMATFTLLGVDGSVYDTSSLQKSGDVPTEHRRLFFLLKEDLF